LNHASRLVDLRERGLMLSLALPRAPTHTGTFSTKAAEKGSCLANPRNQPQCAISPQENFGPHQRSLSQLYPSLASSRRCGERRNVAWNRREQAWMKTACCRDFANLQVAVDPRLFAFRACQGCKATNKNRSALANFLAPSVFDVNCSTWPCKVTLRKGTLVGGSLEASKNAKQSPCPHSVVRQRAPLRVPLPGWPSFGWSHAWRRKVRNANDQELPLCGTS